MSSSKDDVIPLPSQEAYSILVSNRDDETIRRIRDNFLDIVRIAPSNKALSWGRPFLIDEFSKKLKDVSSRLIEVIEKEEVYRSLMGDLLLFQQQAQVILGYYQQQLDSDRFSKLQPKETKLFAAITKGKNSLLDEKQTETLVGYSFRFCKKTTMIRDSHFISDFVTRAYLCDHSSEPGFSYLLQ